MLVSLIIAVNLSTKVIKPVYLKIMPLDGVMYMTQPKKKKKEEEPEEFEEFEEEWEDEDDWEDEEE